MTVAAISAAASGQDRRTQLLMFRVLPSFLKVIVIPDRPRP